jgi:hypothetical protein
MLLYLTKYSCPDLCNVVRELAKCMDKATKGTYLEMLRVVKFVIDTNNVCLRNLKGNIGVSAYFAIVTGPEILLQGSALSHFIEYW